MAPGVHPRGGVAGVNGDVVVVDDVAPAFADLVVREAPHTIALSGGGLPSRRKPPVIIGWEEAREVLRDERAGARQAAEIGHLHPVERTVPGRPAVGGCS